MKLMPLDIRKQEFKKVLRGFDPVEVETFLAMVAAEFESLLKEQREQRERVLELETQIKDYRQIEKSLQQTLLQAQEASGRTYESARREADLIHREAELKASRIMEQVNAEVVRMNHQLIQLRGKKDSLLGRMRVFLNSELELLKALEMSDDPVTVDHLPTGDPLPLDEILKSLDHDTAKAD